MEKEKIKSMINSWIFGGCLISLLISFIFIILFIENNNFPKEASFVGFIAFLVTAYIFEKERKARLKNN
jgi:membrane associated rhomboid family serine protease